MKHLEDVIIYTVTEKEIDIISRLASEIWPVAYADILSEGQLNYMLDLMYCHDALLQQMQQGHTFLLLKLNGEAIGFASYSLIENPGIYKLQKLYALTQKQKKGFGKMLLEYVIEQVKMRGGKALQLNVNRKNTAKGFYEKMGFSVIREEDIDIGNSYYMNDYIMELSIH